jgi:hypothetical protein
MFAKSVHDRLQRYLRFAGLRARSLRGSITVLALLSVCSAVALRALPEQQAGVSDELQQSPLDTPSPATAAQDSAPGQHAGVHADDRRYRALAEFLARKYRVSERMIFNLVTMAHTAGRQIGIDPLLIIAVMAVESRFNPIAESMAGAKGLMQVIPKYHTDKFKSYGGEESVFDPQTNILVGSQILKEYIARTGSVNSALQMYAGAMDDAEDAYTNKVMNEKQRLQQVVSRSTPKAHGTPVSKRQPTAAKSSDNTPI